MECNSDASIAKELQDKYDKKEEEDSQTEDQTEFFKSTLSIVSPDLETLDPSPDIQELFLEFNDRFFNRKLLFFCTVEWADRMDLRDLYCAGVCDYQRQSSTAHIKLSAQILKRRPRKDTVETLLHEMIHAYLFMTRGAFDGHGSEFVFHMERINQESGANITIKHGFEDEVDMAEIELLQGSQEHDLHESKIESDLHENKIESDLEQVKRKDELVDKAKDIEVNARQETETVCIAKEKPKDELSNNYEDDMPEIRRDDEISRIRFLLISGRSGTRHFHPDSTIAEVYSFATTLIPTNCTPSLSRMYPTQSLDMVDKDRTLRQLGFVPSASILVVPGLEPVEQTPGWFDSLLSLKCIIWVIILAFLLGLAYQAPGVQVSSLPDPVDVWNLCLRLKCLLGWFIDGLGGLYCICGYLLVYFALRSMYVGLPYGRLVWVGGYDHN